MHKISKNSLSMSRHILGRCLHPGDTVVDATCGRGQDTLLLAGLVGKTGRVYALDIQVSAINSTYRLLREQGCLNNVILIKDNHVNIGDHLAGQSPQAVMFNLGYLPGGNKDVTTRPDDTIAALKSTLMVLETGGLISVVFYTGHRGGSEEYQQVSRYLSGLPQSLVTVMEMRYTNQINHPPGLLLVYKISEV